MYIYIYTVYTLFFFSRGLYMSVRTILQWTYAKLYRLIMSVFCGFCMFLFICLFVWQQRQHQRGREFHLCETVASESTSAQLTVWS